MPGTEGKVAEELVLINFKSSHSKQRLQQERQTRKMKDNGLSAALARSRKKTSLLLELCSDAVKHGKYSG